MSRAAIRNLVSVGIIALGVLCFLGWDSWVLTVSSGPHPAGIPVGVLGFLFVPVGLLGLVGVNIFAGGPLDPRRDGGQTEAAGAQRPQKRGAANELYDFDPPDGWEVGPESGGTLAICPTTEADWNANMFFDVGEDQEARSLAAAVDDLAASLLARKDQFELLGKEMRTHGSGFPYGVIRYRHRDGEVRHCDHEMIVPMKDGLVLFILASTAEAVAAKYDPIFDRVIESLSIES